MGTSSLLIMSGSPLLVVSQDSRRRFLSLLTPQLFKSGLQVIRDARLQRQRLQQPGSLIRVGRLVVGAEQSAASALAVVGLRQLGEVADAAVVGALHGGAVVGETPTCTAPPRAALAIPLVRDVDRVALTGRTATPLAASQQPPPQVLERVDLDLPVVDVEPPRPVEHPLPVAVRVLCPVVVLAHLTGVVAARFAVPDGGR